MKAEVDCEMCIGCGMCAGVAPKIFRMNEEGKAEAYAEYEEKERETFLEAMDGCPVSAIKELP